MFYILYHRSNILGIFNDLNLIKSEIHSLVHNNLSKVDNFSVVRFEENCNSVGIIINNLLDLPFNLSKNTNEVMNNIFESMSDDETTDDENYDSSEIENESNQSNEESEIPSKPVVETEEEKLRKEKLSKKQSKIDYNLQILKKRKEKKEEAQRIFNLDLDLFQKFKKIKESKSDFEIPPMFQKKYDTMLILEENDSLNFNTFDQVFEKDVTSTKWGKLFTGDAKERELIELTESDDDSNNDSNNDSSNIAICNN